MGFCFVLLLLIRKRGSGQKGLMRQGEIFVRRRLRFARSKQKKDGFCCTFLLFVARIKMNNIECCDLAHFLLSKEKKEKNRDRVKKRAG